MVLYVILSIRQHIKHTFTFKLVKLAMFLMEDNELGQKQNT
jgi:hypothetical protein